jgi:uncharacterized protein (TIGR02421 family)
VNPTPSTLAAADLLFNEIFHDFNFLDYMNPLNSFNENERFFEHWESKKEYNPQFEYRPVPRKLKVWKEKLAQLSFGESSIERAYDQARKEWLTSFELIEHRDTPELSEISKKLFGAPTDEIINECRKELKLGRHLEWTEPAVMGVKGLAEKIRERLREDQIEGWDVMEDKDAVVLAFVDSSKRKIRLQTGCLLTRTMVKRLIHHEVSIHVYRSVNSERQPYRLFQTGFPQHLITEEGLALEMEERMHLQTPQVKKRYAGRVIAASLAPTRSFFELFRNLREYFPDEDAYSLTQRSKRGLKDSSKPGGFVQDHIYWQGKKLVQKLPRSDLRLLFTGKISVSHIPLVQDMIDRNEISQPMLLPGVFHG